MFMFSKYLFARKCLLNIVKKNINYRDLGIFFSILYIFNIIYILILTQN